LAYVEWFTTTPLRRDERHGMYKISRQMRDNGTHSATVISVSELARSVHLYPCFGPVAPREWSSDSV
ncbi:hypothetical protein BC834DRAFT_786580, partial [Gloeopeniophorella convolvens]